MVKPNLVGHSGMDEDFRDPIVYLLRGDCLVLPMIL